MPTSRVLVTIDEAGVPQYEIVENVAWDAIDVNPATLSLVRDADCICWGSLAQRHVKTRSAILTMLDNAREDCLKVFDINLRQNYFSPKIVDESLRRADILKLNEDELPVVMDLAGCHDIIDIIQKYCIKYVIFTCGASFSEVHSEEGLVSRINTPTVKVVDTVGAGDSFTAVFVTNLLDGKEIKECHRKAVEVSAFVCTQAGAINHIPQ